jgi:hypothetical protein
MAIRFSPLKLPDPTVFGVRLQGAFGRGDRQRLLDVGTQCLDRGKLRLLIDCTDLDSLGGSGALVLAELQRQLTERDGEAVFAAAGPVVRRFLARHFGDLPLRCFETLEDALSGLGTGGPFAEAAVPLPALEPADDLDEILNDYADNEAPISDVVRRTADLMTAAYVSLDDVLGVAHIGDNPTAFAEALAILLDAHDLAVEAVVCLRDGERLVSADGAWRLPLAGGVAETLLRVRRPLTLIDVQDGDLWDEEGQFLEDLQPDLILPLFQGADLSGVACLKRGGSEHDYTLPEVFALEMLQRLLAQAATAEADAPEPRAADRSVTVTDASTREALLGVKLELARALQDAQDIPHFWQVFIARLQLATRVTSLLYCDPSGGGRESFAAGEARRATAALDLDNERLQTFFRTLERPVEVVNMPASFAAIRDELLDLGLGWLVSLRVEDESLGVVALGLEWCSDSLEPADEIRELMEITADALLRLSDGQRRANMSLGLLESLVVGRDGEDPDLLTRETVRAVRRLARELGLPPDQERDLVLGALVRNVGQEPGVGDDLSSDQLKADQWERFRAHPEAGDRLMAGLDAPVSVRQAVRHHHERFDGRGFPLGLSGRDIPLMARLVAVAQLYAVALVRDGEDQAAAAVHAASGQALDPDLAEIFLKSLRRVESPISA